LRVLQDLLRGSLPDEFSLVKHEDVVGADPRAEQVVADLYRRESLDP
jgi:hypothetical protein